jgi:hypothetical protein
MTNRILRKLKKFYTQDIVYWAPSTNGVYNYPTFSDPIGITGRWTDKREIVKNDGGEDILSSAILYTDTDLLINGYVMLGDIDDIDSSITGPEDNNLTDVRKIIAKENSPTKKGTEFVRRVWLR